MTNKKLQPEFDEYYASDTEALTGIRSEPPATLWQSRSSNSPQSEPSRSDPPTEGKKCPNIYIENRQGIGTDRRLLSETNVSQDDEQRENLRRQYDIDLEKAQKQNYIIWWVALSLAIIANIALIYLIV